MKKLTLSILSLIFLLCAAIGLVGCGKETHKHSFTEQKVEQQYLASEATCTESAKYYYSCSCGEKGTETFASGNALGHSFTNYVSNNNATCTQDGTKTAKCDRCTEKDTIADENSKLTHVEGELKYDIKPGSDLSSATIKESVYCKLCKELIEVNSYDINLPSKTFSYDGHKHSLTLEGDEIPERIEPVFDNNEQVAAGDYSVTVGFIDKETQTVFATILTAELKINKDGKYHEVVFAYDDVATANVSIAVKHGEKLSESQYPELPQKRGYTVKWVFDGTEIVDDMTISILYTPIEYKITYVLDDASNNPRNPYTYTFESPAITLYAPENSAGLSFQGWYTSPNFEASSRVSTIASGTTGDLTFYAYFLKYKVEAADGFTFDYKSYDYPALTQTVSSTKNTILLSTTIQVSKGCTWTLSRDIEGSDVIKTKNMSLTEGHNVAYITVWYGDDYNLVYYLDVYKLGHRTYSFVADSVTVYPETTVEEQTYISAPTAPEKPGYTFNGWYALSVNPEDIDLSSLIPDKPVTFPYRLDYDTKFLAIFKPNVYTATYDENGGKPLAQKTENITFDTPFTPVEPERDGYTFIGWQDSEGSVFKTLPQWKYLASETFTAQWELNTYSITYVLNGGINPENTVYEYTIEDETIELLAPSRKGYDFCGWFVDADFKKEVTEIAHGSFENKKFYAKWTPTVYEITYVLDGGENDESNPTTYTIESDDITLANPTKTGYTGSWSEGNKLPKGSTGNKIFTAVYTPDVKLSNDGTIVTGLRNTSVKSLVILSEYNGIQVTKIGDSAFKNRSGLTGVTIPDNVTSIGDYAFFGCSGLTSIIIPDSVTTIGDYAFRGCSKLTSITLPFIGASKTANNGYNQVFGYIFGYETKSTFSTVSGATYQWGNFSNYYHYYIPASLKSVEITGGDIPKNAFYNCSGLTSIIIPDSVTFIANSAFRGCSRLTSVIIPNSVTSIGDYAFYQCSKLTSIIIPDSVTSIGSSAFYNCSGLENIAVSSDNAKYHSKGNCLIETESKTLILGCKNSVIPIDGVVTSIGSSAFHDCSGLTSITIPDSVTSIGGSAFSGCSGLTSVTIGNSVTSIGEDAFSGCSGLEYNVYGNALYLGNESNPYVALIKSKSSDIKNCTISDKCKVIVPSAFYNCSGFTSITIPDGVTSIGSSAFSGCSGLTSVTIPDSVTSIGSSAFSGCSGLTGVTIPDNVTSIGDYAFFGCSGLTSVTIGNSVTSIGGSVFNYCSKLTSVTIGNSVTSIGSSAFRDCSGLENIYITDIAAWCKISGLSNLMSYGSSNKKLYLNNELITDLVIPDGVTSIGFQAFYNCSGLTSVIIPNSVTSIGSDAFCKCNGLTSIVIPNSVTSIGYSAFFGCRGLENIYITDIAAWCKISGTSNLMEYCSSNKKLYLNNELITDLVIPDGVTSICGSAFRGCSRLTSVIIPDSVTSISDYAFAYCSGLTTIRFNGTKAQWNAISKGDSWNSYTGNYKYTIYCTNGTLSK